MRELEGFLKAALAKSGGLKTKLLVGGGLIGAGTIAGMKIEQGLGRSQILKGNAFRQQARQRQLERQGSFAD